MKAIKSPIMIIVLNGVNPSTSPITIWLEPNPAKMKDHGLNFMSLTSHEISPVIYRKHNRALI